MPRAAVSYFFGPDREPFCPTEDEFGGRRAAAHPCHGIPGAAVVKGVRDGVISAESWNRHGHLLDTEPHDPGVRDYRRWARDNAVLSFDASALCVGEYLTLRESSTPGGDTPGGDTPGGDTPGGDTPGVSRADNSARQPWEVWGVKEGHTASIWQVSRPSKAAGLGERFAVSVARDSQAANDLRCISDLIMSLNVDDPELRVVRILGQREVCAPNLGEMVVVPVVAAEWVDALELHPIALPGSRGEDAELVAVERFIHSHPGSIAAVRGARLDPAQRTVVEEELAEVLRGAAVLRHRRGESALTVNLAHGDVVWGGEHITVVDFDEVAAT